MKRLSDKRRRFPGYYNHELLNWAREQSGLSVRAIAIKLGRNLDTAQRVFAGTASQKQVWPYALHYRLDWKALHDLDLPPAEFDRAVLIGKAVRSSGPVRVGAYRPAPLKRGRTYTRLER